VFSGARISDGLPIEKKRTGDWQTTQGMSDILARDGNKDDRTGFLIERNLP
jgi:hypothetical protein